MASTGAHSSDTRQGTCVVALWRTLHVVICEDLLSPGLGIPARNGGRLCLDESRALLLLLESTIVLILIFFWVHVLDAHLAEGVPRRRRSVPHEVAAVQQSTSGVAMRAMNGTMV